MKTKKFFAKYILALFTALCIVSNYACGDSDDEPQSSTTTEDSSSSSESTSEETENGDDNDEETENVDDDDEETVVLSKLKLSASIESMTISRETLISDFEVGDTIGLFILSEDLSSPYDSEDNCYNVPAILTSGGWYLPSDVYLSDEDAYIYAYYPYSKSFGNNLPGSDSSSGINLDITTNTKSSDVLLSESVVCNYLYTRASLTFTHSLSLLSLSLILNGNIDSANLTELKLTAEAGSFYDTATLVFENNSLVLLSAGIDSYSYSEITKDCDLTLSSTEATEIDILIHPESSPTITLSMMIDDIAYEIEFSYINGWLAGYNIIYDVNIAQQGLEISTPDLIEGWDTTSISETMDVEYQELYYNGHKAIDLGLSVKWATCNVGASSPEEYGNYYAWGETIPKSDYTSDNYYVTASYNISGNEEFDAARANWGDDWRMPTYNEFNELEMNCTITFTQQNGVYGLKFTSKINGKSIFIPAAGSYTDSGYETFLMPANWYIGNGSGYCCTYWYSTPSDSSRAYCFHYLYSAGFTYLSTVSVYYKYYGFSIRPVID